MNPQYQLLVIRGFNYAKKTAEIWYRRRNRLASVWAESETDYKKQTPKKARLAQIINEIDRKINSLRSILDYDIQNIKLHQLEENETLITLTCNNHCQRLNPDSIGVAIRLADYGKQTHFCPTCGGELRSPDDIKIDQMLYELGIFE